MERKKDIALIGTVSSRKCSTCGHHEIGITTEDGAFYPLRPGTLIQILKGHPAEEHRSDEHSPPSDSYIQKGETQPEQKPWVPDPVKSERSLRLKYGVMVKAGLEFSHINGDIFQAAYLEKLRHLIEKEIDIPITVILDQFFTAPHLASGDPGEIALAMWQELEEIRKPVLLVSTWLENPGEENLRNLLRPKSRESISNNPATDEELERELERLSLEEFLELL